MTIKDFYLSHGTKYNPLPIFPTLYVVKANEFENLVNLKVEMLYRMYEEEFDEEIYQDILYSMRRSWKFLEKKLIKYMVDGKLNLQFIREIANLNMKSNLMIIDFEN